MRATQKAIYCPLFLSEVNLLQVSGSIHQQIAIKVCQADVAYLNKVSFFTRHFSIERKQSKLLGSPRICWVK